MVWAGEIAGVPAVGMTLDVAAVGAYAAVPAPRAGLGRAAVVAPILRDGPGGERIIVTVRHGGLRFQPGQVSLPGGKLEAGEADLRACALREVEEEIGLGPRDVSIVGVLDEVIVAERFVVTPFVGVVRAGVRLVPAEAEVERVVAVRVDELADAGRWGIVEVKGPRSGRLLRAWEVRVNEPSGAELRIWGATARMLRRVMEVGYQVNYEGVKM